MYIISLLRNYYSAVSSFVFWIDPHFFYSYFIAVSSPFCFWSLKCLGRSSNNIFKFRFGMTIVEPKSSPLIGSVILPLENHSSIDLFSYDLPLLITTGYCITSPVIGHINSCGISFYFKPDLSINRINISKIYLLML